MFESVLSAGISQSEFALLMKVSRVSVNKWFTGKSKPRGLYDAKARGMIAVINKAVEQGLLPLPEGVSRKQRVTEIKAALKQFL